MVLPLRFAPLLVALLLAGRPDTDDGHHPVGHSDQGLPRADHDWRPYHETSDHVLNRIARSIWLVRLVPAEVAAALPREHPDPETFFRPGWYFEKRAGAPNDERLFGGDVRQLPRESFSKEEASALEAALAELEGDVVKELHRHPELAVLFQNDLLRLLRRLFETNSNRELFAPLRRAIHAVALPSTAFATLRDPLDPTRVDALRLGTDHALELQRRSTRLFDAARIFAWTTVHVEFPAGAPDLEEWLTREGSREVPLGTHAILRQGALAQDDEGRIHATPITVEVRTKTFTNRDPLSADNETATRDGIDFQVATLRREGLRTGKDVYRLLHLDDQALFRDYGTLKHTTLRAQCTLCHRRTNTPDENLAGFSTLRPSANPRPVLSPRERLELAREEASRWLEGFTPESDG